MEPKRDIARNLVVDDASHAQGAQRILVAF